MLSLSIEFGNGIDPAQWPLSRARMRRMAFAALSADCQSAILHIAVMGSVQAQQLNKKFRRKNYATNILTFDYSGPPDVRADLVICLPVVKKEARAQGKPLDHHLAHLLVHGVLHACGLDHQDNTEAEQMEAIEAGILRRFRIPNPYS